MKFEDWLTQEFGELWDFGDISPFEAMDKAWNAAKEDSKLVVSLEHIPHFYGGIDFSFWQVVGKDFKKTGNFKTKQEAKEWALQNNYRVVE